MQTPLDFSIELGRLALNLRPGGWEFRGLHRLDGRGVKAAFAPSSPEFTMLEAGPFKATLAEFAFGFVMLAQEMDFDGIVEEVSGQVMGVVGEMQDTVMSFIDDHGLGDEVEAALSVAQELGGEVLKAAERVGDEVCAA